MGEENARLLSEKECPPTARAAGGHSFSLIVVVFNLLTHFSFRILFVCYRLLILFKSNVRETWRVILVSEADIFLSESLRILAERLSQSENGLPLRQICYYSPPEEVGVFSTEIKPFKSYTPAYLASIIRSFANSSPLTFSNLSNRSSTCRFFFSSPATS